MKRISEAIDVGTFKDFINPHKRRRWETSPEANEILGVLPDQAQQYFEMLLSSTYKNLMNKMVGYTGIPADRHDLGVVMQCMGAVQQCINIERNHKRDLENIALEMILNLPEMEFVKQAYEDDYLEFDVKLSSGELEELVNRKQEEIEEQEEEAVEEDGDLTPGEETNFNIAEELFDETEQKLRRRLANVLTQGSAINGTFLFHMEPRLQQITGEENILNLYGMASVAAGLGYFIAPPGIETGAAQGASSAGGSEEVEEVGDGKYRIKARGQIFPFLIHEIIKGCYEYLHLSQATKGAEQAHGIEDETDDIVISELPRAIRQLVKEPKYIGIVNKKLIELLDIDDLKKILAGALSAPGSREHTEAQRMVDEIVADIKTEYGHNDEEDGEE
jgi:hypothetical protein